MFPQVGVSTTTTPSPQQLGKYTTTVVDCFYSLTALIADLMQHWLRIHKIHKVAHTDTQNDNQASMEVFFCVINLYFF